VSLARPPSGGSCHDCWVYPYFNGRASASLCGTSACAAWLIYFVWEPLEEIPGLGRVVKRMTRLILPGFMAALYGMGYYMILSR
jgi:hypothetical protein